ncbi:MAG: ATP-binding cassette domain-containing protein [Kiritimatiellia bacterium]
MTPVLRLAGVTKHFSSPAGTVEVLRGIDAEFPAGDFVGLTGPSGSGKSTLLHLAALLDTPSAGAVSLCGRDTTPLRERERCALRAASVSLVFQKFCLLPHRTALQNVLMRFRHLPGVSRRDQLARSREALERVGLAAVAGRRARLLSGGEMQRVAVARAIAARPALLLADEPTGNLDADSAGRIMSLFGELHRDGMTILMATHNPALLPGFTRVLRLGAGRVLPEGS